MSATERILRGVAANVDVTLFDQNGAATAAAGAVTVGVTRADGTVLLAAGTATTSPSTGAYRVALTATHTAQLDELTFTWTDAGDGSVHTTTVDVVGGYYVTLAELRAAKNLADTSKFTDAELIAARAWFEDKFERATGVAWVPRYGRFEANGSGTTSLLADVQQIRTVRSVRAYTTADAYTAFTADEIDDLAVTGWGEISHRFLRTPFTLGNANYVFEVEHGYDAPPTDVKEAAIAAIRDKLLSDQTGNRVYAVQTEAGIVRNSTPSSVTPFGIPFVDEVVAARSHATPAVA